MAAVMAATTGEGAAAATAEAVLEAEMMAAAKVVAMVAPKVASAVGNEVAGRAEWMVERTAAMQVAAKEARKAVVAKAAGETGAAARMCSHTLRSGCTLGSESLVRTTRG